MINPSPRSHSQLTEVPWVYGLPEGERRWYDFARFRDFANFASPPYLREQPTERPVRQVYLFDPHEARDWEVPHSVSSCSPSTYLVRYPNLRW